MRSPVDPWQARIRASQSEDEVLAVVREFLAAVTPEDVSRLPASSRPGRVHSPEDVAALNVQVTREELMYTGDGRVAELLRRMVFVLTEANTRLSQLSLEARLLKPGS